MKLFKEDASHGARVDRIRRLSSLVEARLDPGHDAHIERLSGEELKDVSQILQMARHIHYKYEHKRQVRLLLAELIDILEESGASMDEIDDEVMEMMLSVKRAVDDIKDLRSRVINDYSVDAGSRAEDGGNNLTKSSIPVYTP